MSGPILQAIDTFHGTTEAFRAAMAPEARAAEIAKAVERAKERLDIEGITGSINIAPDALLQRAAKGADDQYDEARAKDADRIIDEMRANGGALAEVMAVASTLPDPLRLEDNTPAGEHVHAMKRVGLLLEREHAERRLANKTYSQVAAMHEGADDRIDHVLKFTIEDQQRRGWPDIALNTDGGDVAGITKLRDVIARAQRARVEKNHPELVQAEAKFKAIQSSAVLAELLRHARSKRLTLVQGAGR